MLADNAYFPVFSKEEFERRRRVLRDAMKTKGLDCLVIYGAHLQSGRHTGHINVTYLSNYAGAQQSYVVLPLQDEPTLIIQIGLHIPNAKEIGAIEDVRSAGAEVYTGVGQRLKELGLEKGNVGIVGPVTSFWGPVTIPVEHHNYLTKMFPKVNFQDVTLWYELLCIVRSEEEIKLLEKAGAITDLAYQEMILSTRPGVRHSDLRLVVENLALRVGGNLPFCHVDSTPMSNPQMVYPNFWPTYRTVEAGHVVMTELPIGLGNYSCKIMGTYFMGEPTRQYRDMYELAAKVYDKAFSELKPGMTGHDTKKWLDPIREAGYTTLVPLVMGWSHYLHSPRVGALDGSPGARFVSQDDLDFVFKPGHCMYICSRVATSDGKGGIWVGACSVMTKDGLRKLNKYPVSQITVA